MNLKDTFGKECWKRAKYYQDQNEKLEAKVKELEKTAQTAIEKFHGKRIDYDYAKEENTKLKAKVKELESDDLYIRGMADADSQDMVDRAKLREENTKLKEELEELLPRKAAEIERVVKLEAALKSIAKNGCCDSCQEAKLVALETLGEE